MNRNVVARAVQGDSELQLWENYLNGTKEYEMVINGVFIMASYNSLSSELPIRNAINRVRPAEDLGILIGGLGMGFTVKEACAYPGVARVDVVEIEPVIVEWNKQYLQSYNKNCLANQRVRLVISDFYDYVINTRNLYDIICMDIDNGPMMLVKESNRRVYEPGFFRRIKEIMNPGAVFVIWSCNEAQTLVEQMKEVFPDSWVERVTEEQGGREVPYFLYYSRKGLFDPV